MLNVFSSIDHRMQPGDCQCSTGRTYLLKYMMYVPVPQKLIFFQKIPLKKGFVCQCGSGRIYFHWSNLFSLPTSIFTGRTYLVKYMVYDPVPQKLIFVPKNFSEKGFVCQCGSGRFYFLWPKKALFVNVEVLLSIISIMWEFVLTKVVIKL